MTSDIATVAATLINSYILTFLNAVQNSVFFHFESNSFRHSQKSPLVSTC